MIGWQNPAALAGLGLLALPVLVHLLRTHRRERILFPTLRFVAPSRTAAVRLRLPTDWLLLLVRLAIVAVSVLAMARPVAVTAARLRGWNARVVRAVVIDTSAGMAVADSAGRRPLDAARQAADAELRTALAAVRIESSQLDDAMVGAAAWLATAPPARRELVVISAFTAGALAERAMAALPATVGVRLMRVGSDVGSRRLAGAQLFVAPGATPRGQQIVLSGPSTAVTVAPVAGAPGGVRVLGADPAAGEAQRLWRAVAAAGTPAPSIDEPIVFEFGAGDARVATPLGKTIPRWMVRTLLRLQQDDSLQRVAAASTGSTLTAWDRCTVVAADRDARPVACVAVLGHELVMHVAAPAGSLLAAASVRALFTARAGDAARPDQEILRIAPDTLAGWSRPSPAIDAEMWQHAERSDARWLWLAALLLLGLEHWLRRTPAALPIEVRDAA